MTSNRGAFGRIILCSIAFAIALAIVASTRVVYGALATGDTGTQSVGSTVTSGSTGSGGTGNQTATNLGQSADDYCAQFIYTLPCGQLDTKTYKKGGEGCSCSTGKLPDGSTIKGTCVFDQQIKAGVCHANAQVAQGSGGTAVSGGSGNSGSAGSTPTSGSGGSGSSGNTGGTSGTGSGSSGNQTNTGGASTGSGSQGTVTGGNLGGSGVLTGGTGALGGSGSQPTPVSTSGSYGGSSNSGGSSPPPISSIGSIANGSSGFSGGLPQNQFQPILTGNNWYDIARYQTGLSNTYYLTPQGAIAPPNANTVIYYYASASQQGTSTYAPTTVTFAQPSATYSGGYSDSGLKTFIESIRNMSDAAINGISNAYQNLSGASNNSPTVPPDVSSSNDTNNPVFDTEITPEAAQNNTSPNTSEQSTNEYQLQQISGSVSEDATARSTVEETKTAAQQIQDSLKELRATVDALRHSNASSTAANVIRGNATSTAAESNEHGNATSSVAKNSATSTQSDVRADRAEQAIEAAEEHVQKIQDELDSNKQKLGESNARVEELTAELNALNDRIKATNQELSKPELSDSQQADLISALVENVQLSLNDAEARLEQAVSESPPPTVGQVVFSKTGNVFSGFVGLTVQISLAITNLIRNFWHALFPAY